MASLLGSLLSCLLGFLLASYGFLLGSLLSCLLGSC